MTTPDTTPFVIRADEAEVIAGGSITLLSETGSAGGAIAVNRSFLPEGYSGVPPHFHERTTEMFFLLDGGLRALVGEQVLTLGPGDVLVVPAGVVHALAPAGGTHADFLAIATPVTDRFDYYRLIDRVQAGAAKPQEILDTQERYDNRFVESAAWNEARAAA